VEIIVAARTDDKIWSLNVASQAAISTFHHNLNQFVEKQHAIQSLMDRHLATNETTQLAIFDALNMLQNQIFSVFNVQYAANPCTLIQIPQVAIWITQVAPPPAQNQAAPPPPADPPPVVDQVTC
jgi:hypothetical protein